MSNAVIFEFRNFILPMTDEVRSIPWNLKPHPSSPPRVNPRDPFRARFSNNSRSVVNTSRSLRFAHNQQIHTANLFSATRRKISRRKDIL
jgi:hypothetical protein